MSSTEFNKYINSSEFKALLSKYENTLESEELVYFDSDDLVDIAEYYHMIDDIENAEAAADYCLKLYPTEAAPLLFKARMALVDYGDVVRAKSLLGQIEEDAESLETVYVTAEIMLSDGGVDKAEEYLCAKYARFMERDAGGSLDDEMEDGEDIPDFALDVAMMYCDHGYSSYAEKWMQKTSVPEGDAAMEYYDTWGRIYLTQARWDKAVDVINKTIDIDAYNVTAWLMMSDALFHQAQYQEALRSVEYAIAIAPDEPEAYLTKGNCLYALNHLGEAAKCFEHYLELCPEDPVGELLIATTYFCLLRTTEAYEHIKKVMQHFDELPLSQSLDALRNCASIAAKMGDATLAMECCDQLEKLGAPSVEADLVRGAVCLETVDRKRAMAYFGKAVEAADYDLKVIGRIGVICFESGLFSMAYKMLKEALAPYRDTGFVSCPVQSLAFFAAACRALGKRKEYLQYLEYAVRLAPLDTSSVLGEYFPSGTEPRDYLKIELEREGKGGKNQM